MKKQKKITNTMQEVAVDILTRLCFAKNIDDSDEIIKWAYEKYHLEDDPFTHLPCTTKEYAQNIVEYNKQAMIEKFGYYED